MNENTCPPGHTCTVIRTVYVTKQSAHPVLDDIVVRLGWTVIGLIIVLTAVMIAYGIKELWLAFRRRHNPLCKAVGCGRHARWIGKLYPDLTPDQIRCGKHQRDLTITRTEIGKWA